MKLQLIWIIFLLSIAFLSGASAKFFPRRNILKSIGKGVQKLRVTAETSSRGGIEAFDIPKIKVKGVFTDFKSGLEKTTQGLKDRVESGVRKFDEIKDSFTGGSRMRYGIPTAAFAATNSDGENVHLVSNEIL